MTDTLPLLRRIFQDLGRAAVAVSGGVDSMTLATVAAQSLGRRVAMFHAVSPAVPPEATARVRAEARRQNWRLATFDAGEFADADYRANPADRCFFCKAHLYGAIRQRTGWPIVSGTNIDDLGDFRPGLAAARRQTVRHPYVEAAVDKAGVRRLARLLGMAEIAELPASPCLASRVETGIPIAGALLETVHQVERLIASARPSSAAASAPADWSSSWTRRPCTG